MSELSKMTAGDPPPAHWGVIDTLARGVRRIHEPVPGKQYELRAEEPTPMPREHALKFLIDPAYEVIDEKGNRVLPIPKIDVSQVNGGVLLRSDQTVARIDELTDAALVARCALIAGGENVVRRSDRDEMVRFVVDQQTSAARRALAAAGRSEDAETEDMDPKSLEKLLGKFAA